MAFIGVTSGCQEVPDGVARRERRHHLRHVVLGRGRLLMPGMVLCRRIAAKSEQYDSK